MTPDCRCTPTLAVHRIDDVGRPVRTSLDRIGEPGLYSVVVEHEPWCDAGVPHGTGEAQ